MQKPDREPIAVDSFEEFLVQLEVIKNDYEGERLLYRGQADSSWGLYTTLDRQLSGLEPRFASVSNYYLMALAAKPQIESFTERRWDAEDFQTDERYLFQRREDFYGGLPLYDFLTYLRHHSFPSPLLDWSKSEFIASFFAFSKAVQNESANSRVAIYVYTELKKPGFKLTDQTIPDICVLGPHVRGHTRHFLQQSSYTICGLFKKDGWYFMPHEDLFSNRLKDPNQDMLWKFTIPVSEKRKVLRLLDKYNLNQYSIFNSEESMVELLAFRIMDKMQQMSL